MQFKVDENLPADSCRILREAGHDAMSVLDQKLGGHPDTDIAARCISESRVLITLDTDFGNILGYPPQDYPGIIVIRTEDQAKPTVLLFVRRVVAALAAESPRGKLWIVEPERIRVRGSE